MIHKYVIVYKSTGKIYFSTAKSEFMDNENYKILEVLLPFTVFTDISNLMEQLESTKRQGFEHYKVGELQREIFAHLAQYATSEKDRTWFYGSGNKKT